MKLDKSIKFESLANKIENSLQQLRKIKNSHFYILLNIKNINMNFTELIEYELETCKQQLESIILKINERLISEIIKIKNPSETIVEIMRLFFIITKLIQENEILNWIYLQTKIIDYDFLKKNLFEILTRNINKETIDSCMNITFNYIDLKFSMSKISKSLVIILDLIKIIVDYSVKKNMKDSLQQTNINVNFI